MSNRVVHFEVQADNIDRAKTFYEKVFGWKIEMMMKADASKPGSMDYWGLTTGSEGTPGINGGMFIRPKEMHLQTRTFDCTILVDDIDEAVKSVRSHGGMIRREKDEIKGVGWFAAATDSEGNMFGLMQATDWKPK